jgi:hypothetical protein
LTASEPVSWSLSSGPPGASLDAETGTLSWTASAADVGTVPLVVVAQGATSADSITVDLEVSCTPGRYALGCGCDSGTGALAFVASLLLRRRRVRRR